MASLDNELPPPTEITLDLQNCPQGHLRPSWGVKHCAFFVSSLQNSDSCKLDQNATSVWIASEFVGCFRKLFSDSHTVFINSRPIHQKMHIDSDGILRISEQYRACLRSLSEYYIPSEDMQSDMERELVECEVIEMIWHVAEAAFFTERSVILPNLLDWIQTHFAPTMTKNLQKELSDLESPEISPIYWHSVYEFTIRGMLDHVYELLSIHSCAQTPEHESLFNDLTQLLQSYPFDSFSSRFSKEWELWTSNLTGIIMFIKDPSVGAPAGLETLVLILAGEKNIIKKYCRDWVQLLVARMLYATPQLSVANLSELVDDCINLKGGSDKLPFRVGGLPEHIDNLVYFALTRNISSFVDQILLLNKWWFAAHFLDLLSLTSWWPVVLSYNTREAFRKATLLPLSRENYKSPFIKSFNEQKAGKRKGKKLNQNEQEDDFNMNIDRGYNNNNNNNNNNTTSKDTFMCKDYDEKYDLERLYEFVILEYSNYLWSIQIPLRIIADYLSICKLSGRYYLEFFILRTPIRSEKDGANLLSLCQAYQLTDAFGVQEKIRKNVVRLRLSNNRVAAALAWSSGLNAWDLSQRLLDEIVVPLSTLKDESLILKTRSIVETLMGSNNSNLAPVLFLKIYYKILLSYFQGKTVLAGSFLLKALTCEDSPKRFWLGLIRDCNYLYTSSINQDELIFSTNAVYSLMQCLEQILLAHNSEELTETFRSQCMKYPSKEVPKSLLSNQQFDSEIELLRVFLVRALTKATFCVS